MHRLLYRLPFLALLLASSLALPAQTLSLEVLPAKAQKALRDFVFIDSGTFTKGIYGGTDTLQIDFQRRVPVDAFYLNRFELSVAEYLEFVADMPGSDNLYDSICWERDFPKGYMSPLTKHYFNAPMYLQHPVVGVNWEQAKAYCAWKSTQINQLLANTPYRVTLRLPSETEWTYAASNRKNLDQNLLNSLNRNLIWDYPWGGLFLSHGKDGHLHPNCNSGPVKSAEGATILDFVTDGQLYTAPVNSYRPFGAGLYNMAGNVAEWTADRYADLFEPLLEFCEDNPELIEGSEHILQSIRDKDAATQEMPHKIIKGGSWVDGAFHAQTAVIQIQDPSIARSTTGFRMALVIEKK